ncbi:MAG: cytochrome c biogenesis protein CcsA [Phycisphaerales bacterium]|nr:MAG: cytochrome c biogenesis protein CcsA [Phycisphaerales bacterium]
MSQAMAMLATVLAATLPLSEAELPTSLDLTTIRGLIVQHDGRWPPLDTLARDVVGEVTGEAFHQGHDPVVWLLAWTFDPSTWRQQPLLPIRNVELRSELQLPETQTVFSFTELVGHQPLHDQIDALSRKEQGHKPNPLESKVSEISNTLMTLQGVFRNQTIKPVPDASNALGTWAPIVAPAHGESSGGGSVQSLWASLKEAFLADDAARFADVSGQLVAALDAMPAGHRPTRELIATELHYNEINPFRTAWMAMVGGAVLAALGMWIRQKWFGVIVFVGFLAGFGLLSYGLSLRWSIAGRIPAANMFESLLFLSWGMGAFAIVAMIFLHQRVVPLTASAMGALALALADCLPLDPFVRPIVPVLRDTVWMSIHVPVIMVSYSVLALGVLFAHVQLVVMAAAPRNRQVAENVDTLHYWYIHVGSILLLIGIVTGSMWAASSWGRYWGWDPKEVWSLVAFLGYLTILHVRIDHQRVPKWAYAVGALLIAALMVVVVPKLGPMTGSKVLALAGTVVGMLILVGTRGMLATAVKSIICFWMIIMTYVGVNYVLGMGLHSYGFGTGAMADWMFFIGGIDLGFIAALTLIYFARRPQARRASPGTLPVAASL